MQKMVVGLPESCIEENVSVMRSYVDAVRRGGHVPLVLPATDDPAEARLQLEKIDLLLLLGGGDVEAVHFGRQPLPTDGTPNRMRDSYELMLFRLALERDMPVVGICRGMQLINIAMGGDLYQDIPSQLLGSNIEHSRPDSKWHAVHDVDVLPDSRLAKVLGCSQVSVNSTHHQSVCRLGESLQATAFAEDGVVEAIESVSKAVAGVQFHPERLAWGDDACFTRLFSALKEFAGGGIATVQSVLIAVLVMVFSGISGMVFAQESMPPDFVRLSDVAPEIMQEMRYYTTYNFVGDRIPGYEAPEAILVRPAADSLIAVNRELMKMGFRIKVMDAYRPQRAVNFFIQWAADRSDERMKPYFYPDCPKSELFKRGYLARRSAHSRGATVDVTLFDMGLGREVDMGSPYDLLGTPSHFNYRDGLTERQIELRQLLHRVMLKHGFKPVSCEWWHFTLRNEPYPFSAFDFPVK